MMMRRIITFDVPTVLVALLVNFCLLPECEAGRIAYSVHTENTATAVSVQNCSLIEIRNLEIELDYGLGGTSAQRAESLSIGETRHFEFSHLVERSPGTEPIIMRVRYGSEDKAHSFVDVVDPVGLDHKQFNYSAIQIPREFVVEADEQLRVGHPEGIRLVPVYPEKVNVSVFRDSMDETVFECSGLFSSGRLPVSLHFLCYEGDEYLGHMSLQAVSHSSRGIFPWLGASVYAFTLLPAFSVAFFCFQRVESNRSGRYRRVCVSVGRWSFTLALFSAFFLGIECLWIVPDRLLGYVYPLAGSEYWLVRGFGIAGVHLLEWLYFTDGNVIIFRRYFTGPMFLYLVLGNLLVIQFLQRPSPESDKNWHFLRTTYSMLPFVRRYNGRVAWTSLAKTGLLAFCVKIFFIPLLVTWAITNLYILIDGSVSYSGGFYEMAALLIAAFIFIDVVVFAAGYLVELPQLGNSIRSVDPSLLGWVVCLMCYPPFNKFSFEYFGTFEWSNLPPVDGNVAIAVTAIVLLLWAVYVWATIALGWKASNLTNRGIVSLGPYKYIRHPAYTAKIAAWGLGAFFLGEKALMVILALCVVYVLRALTEERHLSADSDYILYKQKVRWRFIPFVI